MNWTNWMSDSLAPRHRGPAVYEFRLVVAEHPVPIPRFLGTDVGGTLVYGSTKKLDARHRQAQEARRSANGSSTLNLLYYWERYTALPRAYPGFAYEYRFVALETYEEASLEESRLIKVYACRFGDRPPLNSAFPNRYSGWDEALASNR